MELIIIFALAWAVVRKAASDTAGGGRSSTPGGGPRLGKYGMFDHFTDSYRDGWRRQTDDLIAKRDRRAAERAANPRTKVSWRERAEDRIATRRERKAAGPQPTQPAAPATPPRTGPLFPDPPSRPAATRAPEPTPAPEPDGRVGPGHPRYLRPRPPAPPVVEADGADHTEPAGGQPSPPTTTATPSTEGEPMPGPSGEIVNHETHVAALEDTIRALRGQQDQAAAALSSIETARAAVDAVEADYRPTAEATQSQSDHVAGLNLDATTQGHAAEAASALPANAVDSLHASAEECEAGLRRLVASLEAAIASKEAELAHAQATYADAADTVNSNLSGDARYLDGGGGTNTSTTAPAAGTGPQSADTAAVREEETASAGAR